MKKTLILSLIAIMIILFIITALVGAFPFIAYNSNPITTWTKAICNEDNYCLDTQITCQGDKIVDIKPVTEGIYFSKGWTDPRPETFKSKWC